MKKILINFAAILFTVVIIVTTFIACNYTEQGKFSKLIPYMIIEFLAVIFIVCLANYKAKKEKEREKKLRAQKAMRIKELERIEEAKKTCIHTACTNFCYESSSSYFERISREEERALYLSSRGLESLI